MQTLFAGNQTASSFEARLYLSALGRDGYVSDAGIVISSSASMPTVTNCERRLEAGSKYITGETSLTFTGLRASTRYYVRAYAINAYGTAYGEVLQVTTSTTGTGSAASVTIRDFVSISDGIYMWFTPSSNTAKYYWNNYLSSELTMTDAQIIADMRENGVEHIMSEGDIYEGYAWDLRASSSYTVCVVAYDAAGNAGQLRKTNITTKSEYNQPFATVIVTSVSNGTAYYTITQNAYCSKYVAIVWSNINEENRSKPDIYWAASCYEKYKGDDAGWISTTNITNGAHRPSKAGLCGIVTLAFNSSGVNSGYISKKFYDTTTSSVISVTPNVVYSAEKSEKKMAKKTVDYVSASRVVR